ncbi:MAG: AAA family ATPase [Streptosporangiaceae bacterium]|nr:AAA family ATPase [Streptosporangiaceae bacterium]
MTLYERTEALSCLSRLFTECSNGEERVAIITGAAGTGKTEIMHALSRKAIASNAVYCEATASRAEHSLQFGVISQLFLSTELPADVREQAAQLLEVGAISAQITHDDADEASRSGTPAYIAHALSALLLRVNERTDRPLLIAVDDVHHADPASLRCLASIIGRLRAARIMVVICVCVISQPFDSAFLAGLPPAPYCSNIQLDTLTERGVKALLADHFPGVIPEQLTAECLAITGGNPVMIRALMQDSHRPDSYWLDGDIEPWKLTIGPETTRAFLGILHRCDFAMLTVARCLAILGQSASPVLAGRLAALDCDSTTRTLDALRRTGVLDTNCSRHPELRIALLDGLAPQERATMHARAAELLMIEGAPALAIADHLVSADRTETAWAVPLLHDAAEQALCSGEVSRALRYLRLAHRMPVTETQRAATVALLARAEWRVDPVLAMRHSTEVIADIRSGDFAAQDVLAWVSRLMWFGRADEASEALRYASQSRDHLDLVGSAHLDALQVWMSYVFPATREPDQSPPPAWRTAAESPPVAATPEWQAISMLTSTLADSAGEPTIAAEHFLEESILDERTIGLLIAALATLLFSGRPDAADVWCDSLQKDPAVREAPTWQAMFAALRSVIALRRGDLAGAETQARTAMALIPAKSWGIGVVVPLSVLVRVMTVTGRYKEASAHLRIRVPDALFETPLGLHYLQARGRLHYTRGDFSTALRDFRSIADLMASWHMDLPALVPWRSDSALVHLRLGHDELAHYLVMEQLEMLTQEQTRERGVSLRVLAACEELPNRPARLDEAIQELQKSGDRLELAHALADLGNSYHALGKTGEARSVRSRAHQIAKQCGATTLASSLLPGTGDNAHPHLDTTANHASRERFTNLSDAERRVASLAVDGYSNRQIADKLFVTVSTVEQHLTRVYSKLNVSCRGELPAELHRDSSGPD